MSGVWLEQQIADSTLEEPTETAQKIKIVKNRKVDATPFGDKAVTQYSWYQTFEPQVSLIPQRILACQGDDAWLYGMLLLPRWRW